MGVGRGPDIAVNHSAAAIAVHAANHRATRHFVEDVFDVSPVIATGGRPVLALWGSPDCRHFSRAKGEKPLDRGIRGLAWVITRWAEGVRPRLIFVENVPEFASWGPLGADHRPDASRAGETFQEWTASLRALGYDLEYRVLSAADYGAPTTRRRLFVIARCEGAPIVWPEPTHGPGRARPWLTAETIIEWSVPTRSIFGRRRPLAEATLRRIAVGVRRFAIEAPEPRPFIARHGHYSKITGAGLRPGCGAGTFRGQPLDQPLATVCGTSDMNLVVPVLTKHYGGMIGHGVDRPLGTVTAQDHHALTTAHLAHADHDPARVAEVATFLRNYGDATNVCVTIGGEQYAIVDIGTRMLTPRELFRAQGFPDSYEIAPTLNGRPLTKTQQIRLAGNSVPPQLAAALIRANTSSVSAAAA